MTQDTHHPAHGCQVQYHFNWRSWESNQRWASEEPGEQTDSVTLFISTAWSSFHSRGFCWQKRPEQTCRVVTQTESTQKLNIKQNLTFKIFTASAPVLSFIKGDVQHFKSDLVVVAAGRCRLITASLNVLKFNDQFWSWVFGQQLVLSFTWTVCCLFSFILMAYVNVGALFQV